MSYTLEQVRGFVAVAEEGHFGRAAERLMMTQPPLSRQVQKLEREVGVTLFRRTSRGTELTLAGQAFLVEARRLLNQVEAAPLTARRVSAGTTGSVRMGFTMIGSLNVLGQWVRQAQVNLPGVEVVLSEMVTSDQVQALLAHELDLGLLRGQPRPEVLKSRLIHSEQLVLAVPADHPLATAESVTLQDVARYPLITYSPAQARYFYELVIATFQEAGLSPTYVQYVNQVSTILTLVDAGVGAGMVPESVSSLKLPHVRYRSVAGLLPLQVELFASWRRDNDNPALATMLQMISP